MIPVAPHVPVPPPDAIERAGHATGEAVDAGTQAVGGVSLDDEMNVIGLNGQCTTWKFSRRAAANASESARKAGSDLSDFSPRAARSVA